jgi:hypothetical protein
LRINSRKRILTRKGSIEPIARDASPEESTVRTWEIAAIDWGGEKYGIVSSVKSIHAND